MIRESTLQNSKFAFLCIDPSGNVSFGCRSDGLAIFEPAGRIKFYSYMRVLRKGDNITAYISPDASNWEQVGSVTLNGMGPCVLAGMATASKDPITYVNAEYYNVVIK